jgi:GNAT superfamily N-acetyltransferase
MRAQVRETMAESATTIRRAESRDMAFIIELWRGLAGAMAELDERVAVRPDAEILWAKWVGARLRDDSSCVLVAEVGGDVVGYLLGHVDEAQPIYQKRRHALISDVFVDPAHRGKGVGTKLVEEAFAFFRGKEIDHVRANVLGANAAGRTFWEKQGASDFLTRLWKPLR